MIVLDIETSGFDYAKCGIWQIGAIDLENPGNVFFEECRIDDEDFIEEGALRFLEKTEEELRDKDKQSQKEMFERFFEWAKKVRISNLICQNPQFDLAFILTKVYKYNLNMPLHHRAFDLHSIAHLKYFQIYNKFLIKDNHSDMGLTNTLEFCGMKDNRGIHNALEDAKLTAECFFRLVYGKNLFEEFREFEIPDYLRRANDNL